MIAQTSHDQALLRERVARLGGPAGLSRLAAALEAVRQQVGGRADGVCDS